MPKISWRRVDHLLGIQLSPAQAASFRASRLAALLGPVENVLKKDSVIGSRADEKGQDRGKDGASGGRTHKVFPPADFKSAASADSAIAPER
jgi:hypothetical protein